MKIVFWRSLLKIKFKNLQISYEDCILKITFEDQVQKFTDFFEDCILEITFEDQVQKFTDFL